jgi:hypothetical protein
MHGFLIFCVLAEAVAIGLLWRKMPKVPHGLTETIWAELVEKLYDHTEVIAASEAKILDLAEGCERLDSDLSLLSGDFREFMKLRSADARAFSERISEIVAGQEDIRRKAGRPGSPGFAWEGLKSRAESNAQKVDPAHAKLVALAEGPESV